MTKHEYTPPVVVELGTPGELILGGNGAPDEPTPNFLLPSSLFSEYDE